MRPCKCRVLRHLIKYVVIIINQHKSHAAFQCYLFLFFTAMYSCKIFKVFERSQEIRTNQSCMRFR